MAVIATRDSSGLRLLVRQERDLQDWFGLFCQAVVWAWLCVGMWLDWGQRYLPGLAMLACGFACSLIYFGFKQEAILVSPTSMKRHILLFGIALSKSKYKNASVRQLRYFEGTEDIFNRSAGVRFEMEEIEVVFVRGIGRADGKEIVAQLRAEYPFPPFDGKEEPGSNLLGLRV